MAGTARLVTLGDAVLSLKDKAKLTSVEEAAGGIGGIIFDQFYEQKFWKSLPKVFAPTCRLETDGRILGPWLLAVSTGECEWNDIYPVNYLSLLSNYMDGKLPTGEKNNDRVPFSQQPDQSFLKEVESLSQPLMREFQTDPRVLSTIVTKSKHSIMGQACGPRSESLCLDSLVKTINETIGPGASAAELKDWLVDDRNLATHPGGIWDIEITDDQMVTFHREADQPIKRKFKTFFSNYYRK